MAVTNVAELNALVERVKKAQREYASFTQEQVDKIFRAAALVPSLSLNQSVLFAVSFRPLTRLQLLSSNR